MTHRFLATLAATVVVGLAMSAPGASAMAEESQDAGILKVRLMGSDMAATIATGAVHACRAKGYQISAVVLDRGGDMVAAHRDTFAARHSLEIAERKAGAVILSGVDSGTLRDNRQDIAAQLNLMKGIILMEGGVQIRAAGSLIGAVGVSGAPGGDIDASCAQAGIDLVRDKLDFAD